MKPIQKLIRAIANGNLDEVSTGLQKRRRLLNYTDDKGQSLLHLAARAGHDAIVAKLLEQGLNVAAVDSVGDTPLHAVCLTGDSALDTLKRLINAGAVVTAANGQGQTAAHYAAMTGRLGCITELAKASDFGDAIGPDSRGWTALDCASAAGQVEIEDFLINGGYAIADDLVLSEGEKLSTVDILMLATKAETDELKKKAREQLEELYRYPEFRHVLDLAAANATGSRAPRDMGKKALRIFIANSDGCAEITDKGGDTGRGGHGALNPKSNTLTLGGADRTPEDILGTLIHELTHAASDYAFGSEAVPYGEEDSDEGIEYREAIARAVKKSHLYSHQSDSIGEVSETIIGRINQYSARTGKDKNGKPRLRQDPLQEYLVGVPQAIVQHGELTVEKVAPDLLNYFKGRFKVACENKKREYVSFTSRVDNAELLEKVKDKPESPPLPESWVDVKKGSLASLVLLHQRALRGSDPKPMKYNIDQELPPVLLTLDYLTLPEDSLIIEREHVTETKQRTTKRERVTDTKQKRLREVFQDAMKHLPPEVSEESLEHFLDFAAQQWEDGGTEEVGWDEMCKNLGAEVRKVVRKTRIEYLQRAKNKGVLTRELVAETLIYEAACQALDDSERRQEYLKPDEGPDLSDSKVQDLIRTMASKLDEEKINAFLDDPRKLTDTAKSLAKEAFFTKDHLRWQNKTLKQKPTHVSIDKKEAKLVWIEELATLTL